MPRINAAARAPAHLISRAEMARMLGVSRPAVTNACKPGGRLAAACDGASINVLHADAQRWLVERARGGLDQVDGATPARATREQLGPEPELDELPPIGIDEDGDEPEASRSIEDLEDELGPRNGVDLAELAEPLTVLTERYHDAKEFESWIRARKALEEARKAQMIRERLEGRLIARTTVVRMFEHIDTAFRLLLSDAPRSIATRIAPQDVAGVAALVRDVMSQHLAACRGKIDVSLASDDPMAPLAEAAE